MWFCLYDLLIKNARVVDGTGSPWVRNDVAVQDGVICKIGTLTNAQAKCVVDAQDKYLTPGFIDIHCHSDATIMNCPTSDSRILQGVTTELGGDCGISTAPVHPDRMDLLKAYSGVAEYPWRTMAEYLDYIESLGVSTNFATAVGHGTIRLAAMGFDDRKPTADELEEMKQYLRQSMEGGAFCMSSGLIYPPGCFADAEELTELCKELKPYGGFYETHMRNESTDNVKSVTEALTICWNAKVPLQIAHHKVTRSTHWGVSCKSTIAMIKKAREAGMDVMLDQYPYRASSTSLSCNVPNWAFEGGMEALLDRLADSELRPRIVEEVAASHLGRWHEVYVSYVASEKNAYCIGKSIPEIAEIRGCDPTDACLDLILEERGRVNEIHYGMCEEDIEYIMSQRFTMTGSDGNAASLDHPGMPHPRWYGAFPRVIAHYSRDRKCFPLETAIHKMTGLPAARLGLPNRGLLKVGMAADLVLFDLDTIQDTPTFENPKQPCAGILRVYVNGVLTAENGKHTGARAGTVLRKGINS